MKIYLQLLIAVLAFALTSCKQVGNESDHKVEFPASAENFQNRGNSAKSLLDRGITTILEIDSEDLDKFVAKLKINERRQPVKDEGDPTVNGWNVWPQDARTFVPGNKMFGGFERTWDANPVPVEMLSCQSEAGDWLHVEIWKLSDNKTLLKLFTSWN